MKNRVKNRGILFPMIALLLVACLLLGERLGVNTDAAKSKISELPKEFLAQSRNSVNPVKECLIVSDSTQEEYEVYLDHISYVLQEMKVGYDVVDLYQNGSLDFTPYQNVVIAVNNIDKMGEAVIQMVSFVENGGGVLFLCTPDPTYLMQSIYRALGIVDGGLEYASIGGMVLYNNFMMGTAYNPNYEDTSKFTYVWESPATTALNVQIGQDCVKYAESYEKNSSRRMPLVWSHDWGAGRFVVNNHGMCEKANRGITAASYCLLQDAYAYPVINASTWFLDDFPSPVPMGDGTYIKRDYNRDIASFYSNIWWPDLLSLCKKYGIAYTGLMIGTYEDNNEGPFALSVERQRYNYFGGMLLENHGEVGIHGYNHQPLCMSDFDFRDKVDYKYWNSMEDMRASLEALEKTAEQLYDGIQLRSYVPPSNILSDQGREVLGTLPGLRTICSVYLKEDCEYEQEFSIAEDGIVEYPRVISGTQIDDYMYFSAMNELNFHFINSHFMHPDDALDEDRGAAKGWASMFGTLSKYCEWLYGSTSGLRNLTANDSASALERYTFVWLDRELTENSLKLTVHNLYDEAYFIVKISDGRVPANVVGGELYQQNAMNYLLKATQENVEIFFDAEGAGS